MVVDDSPWGINATKIMKIMLLLSEKMIFFGSNHKGGYLMTNFSATKIHINYNTRARKGEKIRRSRRS